MSDTLGNFYECFNLQSKKKKYKKTDKETDILFFILVYKLILITTKKNIFQHIFFFKCREFVKMFYIKRKEKCMTYFVRRSVKVRIFRNLNILKQTFKNFVLYLSIFFIFLSLFKNTILKSVMEIDSNYKNIYMLTFLHFWFFYCFILYFFLLHLSTINI